MTSRESNQITDMQEWLGMIERLGRAPDWPEGDRPVETVQTHISVILLGKRYALKLKKPVNFGFLDYTTLEKRRLACEAEIVLNRRLCAEAYLGVQAVRERAGQLYFAGAGEIVEYGVLMKRLPGDRLLDRLIATDEVSESMIERVAERLYDFHQTARRGTDIASYGSPEVIRANWQENFTQTAPYINRTISPGEFNVIQAWVIAWMESHREILERRQQSGRICDGHGDLRSESICVTDGLCIFDCIEFNERFRCGDVASEVAFLAMDLDARGRPDLGYYFTEQYQARADDPELFDLLAFYRCYRAYVRGKVLSFKLDEKEFSEAEQSASATRAKSYFHLARRYATPLEKPTIILVAGLSGTGKTSLARAIAGELGIRVVSADAVRKSLFDMADRAYAYGEGPYSREANLLTYKEMIGIGTGLLAKDKGVVLDATFRRASDRALAHEMAMKAGANLRVIECRLEPASVQLRLDRRTARGEGLSDATWTTYLLQNQEFEPLDQSSSRWHLRLDTGTSLSVTSHVAADWLRDNDSTVPASAC